MREYIESLKGISYSEWIKLRTGMDRAFEHEKGELEKKLKFANTEVVERLIRTQFGEKLD